MFAPGSTKNYSNRPASRMPNNIQFLAWFCLYCRGCARTHKKKWRAFTKRNGNNIKETPRALGAAFLAKRPGVYPALVAFAERPEEEEESVRLGNPSRGRHARRERIIETHPPILVCPSPCAPCWPAGFFRCWRVLTGLPRRGRVHDQFIVIALRSSRRPESIARRSLTIPRGATATRVRAATTTLLAHRRDGFLRRRQLAEYALRLLRVVLVISVYSPPHTSYERP